MGPPVNLNTVWRRRASPIVTGGVWGTL